MKPLRALLLVTTALLAQDATFKVDINLVVANVSVKDRNAKPIMNLRKEDFEVFEDGVPQTISVFDVQKLSEEPLPPLSSTNRPSPSGRRIRKPIDTSVKEPSLAYRKRFQDRRLIVLFFDLASMQPAEQARAQRNAVKFIETQMTVADMVSIMTFSSALRIVEDFTEDRERLSEALRTMSFGQMSDLAGGGRTNARGGDGLPLAEQAEFNIFNTDRKLKTLERAARDLGEVQGKKALVLFSSGIEKTGSENLSQLKATVNAAVRSGVSFYTVDARGLVALPPGGDASTASPSGTGILTGAVQQSMSRSLTDSQETLYTLAADTGGRAMLDSNDLTLGIRQAQQDLNSYYLIGYRSTNSAEDSKYRRLRVRLVNNPEARLDYRSGYYATRSVLNAMPPGVGGIEEALTSGVAVTELPMALEVDYFRIASNRYFAPISVKIPGSVVDHTNKGARQTADLDFIGAVHDSTGELAGGVHDHIGVNIAGDAAHKAPRPLQYDTGLTLSSGSYSLIFLVRDNRTGKIGTFETKFTIPDLDSEDSLRVSSIILSGQKEALSSAVGAAANNNKLQAIHPLVQDGQKTVPSITRVFRQDQTLYVYFEVYDPSIDRDLHKPSVTAELDLLSGERSAFKAQPVRLTHPGTSRPGVIPFAFQVPLANLESGEYTSQVTIIDELGSRFALRRNTIHVVP
jgi:VWFA-related protein